MRSTNTGGPAFPIVDTSQNTSTGEVTVHQAFYSGMTLRDYFAAKAISAVLAGTLPDKIYCEVAAKIAYEMADAMLKAREA